MQIVGLNFDILKIDHSLIDTILTDQTAARMFAASSPWRRRSGCVRWLKVETWETPLFLRAAGVDCGQGWFWSKAVAARDAAQDAGGRLSRVSTVNRELDRNKGEVNSFRTTRQTGRDNDAQFE